MCSAIAELELDFQSSSPLHPGLRMFHNVHTAGGGITSLTGHQVNHIVRILESDQHLPQNVDMLVK